ncbi:pre-peptidase C-terminal domain-containing protein [Pleionea sediminis]|uniref:pre-peptidase C-terminal domain-containing protein n=1 Tax=Pleionea sediminis TaxID=2569479 RepID=UPI001FEA251E|nr:pre-peptidase C-terminal domain-containing protein [Pleionea sediminis]
MKIIRNKVLLAFSGLLALNGAYASKSEPSDAQHLKPTLHPQMQQVAKPVAFNGLLSNKQQLSADVVSQYNVVSTHQLVIKKPGASFIKVHFSHFKLVPGLHVEVRSLDGSEVHRYGSENSSLHTLRDGDDGVTSFSALSIFGEGAIVEVVGQDLNNKNYRVEIDSIMEGFPESMLEEPGFGEMTGNNGFSTCGVNERRDVQCYADSHPVEFERSRPVARLLIAGSGSCTAWRVGPDNRMFTNNHCISSATGPGRTEVWFNYQRSGCGSGSTSGRIKVTGDELLSTNSDLDYTLFTLKNFDAVEQFGYYGLDVRSPIEQERIFIPQHGRGQPKQLSIVSDQNSDGLCRVDVTLADGSAPNTDMGYMCDTIGGSSGSPVLAASSNKAIALHHFGGCPNQGVLINLIWPEVAEHFGNVIPNGDNSNDPNPDPDPDPDPQPNTPPVASFSFEIDNLTVSFSNNSSDSDGTIANYAWDFGDGNSSTEVNPTHSYATGGDFTATLTVTDDDGDSHSVSQEFSVVSDTEGELANGIPVSDLAESRGEELHFYIDVPESALNLSFNLSGGSGDADLYVRFGEEPTQSTYDCRPYKSGNSETCQFGTPEAGRYFVMIRAYNSFSNASLVADYFDCPPFPAECQPPSTSFEETDLSDSRGGWTHFTIEVPEGVSELTSEMFGGSGDGDMYVRFGTQPTTYGYDCRPYKYGNTETCRISNPSAGTWYISIRAYNNYSGVTLRGNAE